MPTRNLERPGIAASRSTPLAVAGNATSGILQRGRSHHHAPPSKLPEIEDEDLQTVIINPPVNVRGRGANRTNDRDGNDQDHIVVEVPEKLVDPHPLVQLTAKSLRAAKPDYRGLVKPPSGTAARRCGSTSRLSRPMSKTSADRSKMAARQISGSSGQSVRLIGWTR